MTNLSLLFEELNSFDEQRLTEAPDMFGATEAEIDANYEAQLAALKAKRDAQLAARTDKIAAVEEAKKLQSLGKSKVDKIIDSKEYIDGDFDTKLQMLFEEFVPSFGSAETVGGELIRALMRIIYRDYNNGDVYYFGYGVETAGPAAAYIAATLPEVSDTIYEMPDKLPLIIDVYAKLKGYTKAIKELAEDVVNIITEEKPELFATPNYDDMFNYTWKDELLFDYDPDISGDYIDQMTDADFISWNDIRDTVDEIVSDNFRSGDPNWWASDAVTIQDLTYEDYLNCKDNFERWFYDWVDEKYTEYESQLEDEEEDEED